MTFFTIDEFAEASQIVARHMAPTPQFVWPLLDEAVGAEIWLKHENCTPTGAFKVRGGLVYIDRMVRERPMVNGVVCATRGNHGQSLAFSGRAAGVPVTIIVPHGNSPDKNAAMRGFGAELIEHGVDFQAALEYSAVLAEERGLEAVPSFDRDLCRGVATYAHELFKAAGQLDVVYVPVGLGRGSAVSSRFVTCWASTRRSLALYRSLPRRRHCRSRAVSRSAPRHRRHSSTESRRVFRIRPRSRSSSVARPESCRSARTSAPKRCD